MRLRSCYRLLLLLVLPFSLNACIVLLPFIEQDNQRTDGHSSSYAFEKSCTKSKDPTVHFFAPQTSGAIADVKRTLAKSSRAPRNAGPRLSKRERKLRLLLRQLEKGDEIVRTHAASDLGMMGSQASSAVDELARALRFDSSKWVRRAAARSLGKIGSKQGIAALKRAVQTDRNKYVAHSAQRSLQRISRSF